MGMRTEKEKARMESCKCDNKNVLVLLKMVIGKLLHRLFLETKKSTRKSKFIFRKCLLRNFPKLT